MCVAAIAWSAHPRWHLVAIGNRDEYHDRPAGALSRWVEAPDVIAGRDLKSGGTWLGVSEAGRFALITNRRGFGDPDPTRASRGQLVTDLLTGRGRYADANTAPLAEFNPFNLFVADADGARFLANRPDEVRAALAHGIYGLSNGRLDAPWPKTLQLKQAVFDWLNGDSRDFAPLFRALANDRLSDAGLPPREPSDIALEPRDTPAFIRNPIYGTRCSTVVAIDRTGQGRIVERRFSPEGAPSGDTEFRFTWPPL